MTERTVTYVVAGDLTNFSRVPIPGNELWRSTCFELFYAAPMSESYCEINISPDGRVILNELCGYRSIVKREELQWDSRVSEEKNLFTLICDLPFSIDTMELFPAVITADMSGNRNFWSVEHGEKPDFHLRERFRTLQSLRRLG